MEARVVIGANCGDEGKGTVVAKYTSEAVNQGKRVLNVLTNGGAQRGHTVRTKLGDVTFQHFGSGTYHGADSYYSRYFILNPVQFVKEYEALIIKPKRVYRDRRCRWTTIYDMMANKIEAELTGTHASCCMGIWNTVKRFNEGFSRGAIYFDDFMRMNEFIQMEYLMKIKHFYERNLTIPDKWKNVWDSPYVAQHFIQDCQYMFEHTLLMDMKEVTDYEVLILENGQGLLLSDSGVNTSDTTPSRTGAILPLRLLANLPSPVSDIKLHYVSRTYLTRHGDGYLENETSKGSLSTSIEEDTANHYNENQGHFRYGLINYADLLERISEDAGAIDYELELTHCDELDNVDIARRYFSRVNVHESPLVL